jgi:maltose alpha-D-glucosyltransferase/alpha-amylase
MAINVADQRRDPQSLLNWMERIIRRRHETPALGWGASRVLASGDHSVLAHRTDWENTTVVLIHNLASEPRSVRVDVGPPAGDNEVVDLLDQGRAVTAMDEGRLELKLEGYGFRWFRIEEVGGRTTP